MRVTTLLIGILYLLWLLSAKKHTNSVIILMDDMGYGDVWYLYD